MTDKRRHRGMAPGDERDFAAEMRSRLREAAFELSWLLGRDYAEPSALKLVGDRHQLTSRQRAAVRRSSCSEAIRTARLEKRVAVDALEGRALHIDGFNALIVCESLLSGGVVLVGRDGAHRDLASVHGTWRKVVETSAAIDALADVIVSSRPASVRWLLDRPVSNSGRLKTMLMEHEAAAETGWSVELVDSPDRLLAQSEGVVASADGWVIDQSRAWVDLPGAVRGRASGKFRVVELGERGPDRV